MSNRPARSNSRVPDGSTAATLPLYEDPHEERSWRSWDRDFAATLQRLFSLSLKIALTLSDSVQSCKECHGALSASENILGR
jgi:hypothetical protein